MYYLYSVQFISLIKNASSNTPSKIFSRLLLLLLLFFLEKTKLDISCESFCSRRYSFFFFFIFQRKYNLIFHVNRLPSRSRMNCQVLFTLKNTKKKKKKKKEIRKIVYCSCDWGSGSVRFDDGNLYTCRFSIIFYKEDNFCDVCFPNLHVPSEKWSTPKGKNCIISELNSNQCFQGPSQELYEDEAC